MDSVGVAVASVTNPRLISSLISLVRSSTVTHFKPRFSRWRWTRIRSVDDDICAPRR